MAANTTTILRSWDVKTRQCTAILQGNNEQGVCGMVLAAGSRLLYSACYDSKVKEWNLEDGSSQDLTASLQYDRCISSVALSGNGLCLVSASQNMAQFQVWEKIDRDTEFFDCFDSDSARRPPSRCSRHHLHAGNLQ